MFDGRWTARHDWVEEFAAKHDGLNAAAFHAYLVHVGASASVRRDFYETSGGMDSDLKLGEDVELGYRLAQRGAVFVPDNEARSWHLGRSTLMRRQEEVNRYNRPFVTDRITDLRHWRSKGRSYSVPWLQAVVDTEGRSFESVSHTVDGLLRGSVSDIEIVLLGDWTGHGDERRPPLEDEHLDARMLHAEYVGEPRVRFQKEVGTTAFPSAWRLELPAGWAPGRDTLRKLTREANNQVRGLLSVTMPDGTVARFERTSSFARALRRQGLPRGRRRRRRRHHRLLVVRRPRGGLHPRVVARADLERRPQPGRRTPAPGPVRRARPAGPPPPRARGHVYRPRPPRRGDPQGHRPPRSRRAAPPAALMNERAQVTVGIGAGAAGLAGHERGGAGGELATQDMVLNIGPQHPATHGVLRLRLVLDGERIVARRADRRLHAPRRREALRGPRLPADHRAGQPARLALGVRQRARRRARRRADARHGGARSGRSGPRTLLAELNRVLNHLMFLGSYPLELGAITPIFYAFREREDAPGGDGGGLRRPDALHVQPGRRPQGGPAGRLARPGPRGRRRGAPPAARAGRPDRRQRDLPGPHPRGRRADRASTSHAYGVSGPIARASGVDFDLRRDEPYLAYGELPRRRCRSSTRDRGRLPAPGFEVLLEQVHVSLDLAEACLDRLRRAAAGPDQRSGCRRCSRRPRATPTRWTENPLGINGYYLVSRGREDAVAAEAALGVVQQHRRCSPSCCRACLVADMVAILGSMFFVVGDIDK